MNSHKNGRNKRRKARKRHRIRHILIRISEERLEREKKRVKCFHMKEFVLEQLSDLGAYLFEESKTTNSFYIKFKYEYLGSLRISDHDGISKYKYKWNLRNDIKSNYTENDRGVNRRYFPFNEVNLLIQAIKTYQFSVERKKNYE